MDELEKPKLTRWQFRCKPEMEKYIRELAEKERRSINLTLIFIVEQYRREHGDEPPKAN